MLRQIKRALEVAFGEQWRVSLTGSEKVYSRNWFPTFDEAVQFSVAEIDHNPETLHPKPEAVQVELTNNAETPTVVLEKRLSDGRISVSVKGPEAQLEGFPIVDSSDKSVALLFELYSCIALNPADARTCAKLRSELRRTRI
jgi:hypothetical protein